MEERKKSYLNAGTTRRAPRADNMIFGTRSVIEAIRAGKEIDKIFIQKGLQNDLIAELNLEMKNHHLAPARVPVEKLDRLSKKNHQGVIAFLSEIEFKSLDNVISEAFAKGENPFILVLDRITDVRNFGAVARSAECAGAHAIVIPARGAAAVNSDAVKTSAGALHHIPVCRENSLKFVIKVLKESGVRVIACTEKTEQNLFKTDLTGPVAILMGSEEDGISPELLEMADEKAKIPMFGKIESLNISVAASICLYECVRQRAEG